MSTLKDFFRAVVIPSAIMIAVVFGVILLALHLQGCDIQGAIAYCPQ